MAFFVPSSPLSRRRSNLSIRFPERGLMDPYPLLQELSMNSGAILTTHDGRPRAPNRTLGPDQPMAVAANADIHDWERQLQENRSRARTMSMASRQSHAALNLDGLDEPAPSRRHRAMHIPTRTR